MPLAMETAEEEEVYVSMEEVAEYDTEEEVN